MKPPTSILMLLALGLSVTPAAADSAQPGAPAQSAVIEPAPAEPAKPAPAEPPTSQPTPEEPPATQPAPTPPVHDPYYCPPCGMG